MIPGGLNDRLLLEYFDHNDSFAPLLPKAGRIERNVIAADGNAWALFRPDSPIEYEGLVYQHLLLRSRWKGYEIGGPSPTSVFILLVTDAEALADGFDVRALQHVAWGMVKRAP